MYKSLDKMRHNAIALANYFVDKSISDEIKIYQFGLMKRVYITHGFCLASLDRGALDPLYDVVEAWKNGPVIPSVYHSFKHHTDNEIRTKSFFVTEIYSNNKVEIETPVLKDEDIKDVADFVWGRYKNHSDYELVKLLHRKGTPWYLCYKKGENRPIPDLYTKTFYKKLIRLWDENSQKN